MRDKEGKARENEEILWREKSGSLPTEMEKEEVTGGNNKREEDRKNKRKLTSREEKQLSHT